VNGHKRMKLALSSTGWLLAGQQREAASLILGRFFWCQDAIRNGDDVGKHPSGSRYRCMRLSQRSRTGRRADMARSHVATGRYEILLLTVLYIELS
jgi:hypothetical protein